MQRFHRYVAVLGFLGLAACGGGNTGPTDYRDVQQRAQDALDQIDRVNALSPTAFKAMPTSGRATFTGSAGLIIDPQSSRSGDEIVVLGDSRMTADFARGTMRGDVTNMIGGRNPSSARDYVSLPGRIDIGTGASVVGDDVDDNLTSRPNDWYADYTGHVTVAGQRWNVEGDLFGQFYGTRVGNNPITTKAIAGIADNGTAVRPGQIEEVSAPMEIIAEN